MKAKSKQDKNVPNLRFREFEGEWEKHNLSDIAIKVSKKNTGNKTNVVFSNSATQGIVLQNEYFDKDIASKENLGGYYVVEPNYFVYNPRLSSNAEVGAMSVNHTKLTGLVSPLYMVFRLNSNNVENSFLEYIFKSKVWHNHMRSVANQGARDDRMNVKDEDFFALPLIIPQKEEQTKIAKLLQLVDSRISTQSQIIEELETLQISLIDSYYRLQHYENSVLLTDCIVQKSERNKKNEDYPVLSVSNKFGFIKQSEQFENRGVASEDTSNYKIVRKNDFAYNPARINVGSVARLTNYDSGIVSPMYVCFHTKDNLLSDFLEFYFSSQLFKNEMNKRLEGSVRQCLTFESLCDIPICFPPLDQQRTIATYLVTIQKKINIENSIKDLFLKQKKYLLNQMFI